MAEAGRGQVGGDGTAVRVPHHNQTIITTCHQGMVALQCFRSWISGGMCLLVLTEATKTDKAEGVGVLGGVRQRWWVIVCSIVLWIVQTSTPMYTSPQCTR
jgi:hypothetical protein